MITVTHDSIHPDTVDFADSTPQSWQDAWRKSIRNPHDLLSLLGLQNSGIVVSEEAHKLFPMRVPLSFIARMRYGDPHDPLLRQVLPIDEEMQTSTGLPLDAVGDAAAKVATGVIHKYNGRVLLISTGSCAINCRYCFRRHFPYSEETAARDQWQDALAYLRSNPNVNEVILSGGDPLSLSTKKLAELTDELRFIPHIKRLRIHTRIPIVLPERIDTELLHWLSSLPWGVAMVLHSNHANEFNEDLDSKLVKLRKTGVHLLNQAVLLKGVNDSIEALIALSERSFAAGVLPYYLHQLDCVPGVTHFEISDAYAIELHQQLQAQLSGYLVPKLVREVAGDSSKRPLV